MDIKTEKIELVKLLLETENPRIIQAIKNIFEKEGHIDFWDGLIPFQQQQVKKGDLDFEEGRSMDYEAVMAKHR